VAPRERNLTKQEKAARPRGEGSEAERRRQDKA